ncbi:MAG TPA: response regulator transcription factor [Pyrinomonadaceae bacterium]|nr:response regulator transcription factor [Pyrinomonadaceae bacterium]
MRASDSSLQTMPENTSIRTAIIEDDDVARDCLRLLVGGTPGYECVGTFSSVEDALQRGFARVPDVLLLDIHLPGMLGSEGVKLFHERYPQMHILMLTVYAEQGKIFESICNGACGYLLKKTPPARLLEAIREAHEGGAPMTPEIARKVVTLFQQTARPEQLDEALTPHELRLLKLLAEGYSYQDAADQFRVSINTLRNHIRSIYDKLHVHSKSAAVSKALRYRLIS